MPRVFDIDGHPWSDGGRQAFRLTTLVQDLSPDDVLRLTDRATGHKSYWRISAPGDTGLIEQVDGAWRGVLAQTDWQG